MTERRGYGYDIANRLQERLGPSFRAVSGAVYVSLDQLVRERLAAEAKRVESRRQVKVYYEATAQGRDRFSAWMSQSPAREPLRGELYLKLAVARGQHLPLLRAELERLERECMTELQAQTNTMALGPGAHDQVGWEVAARWLTDAAALERLGGDLRWIRMALRTIEQTADDGSIPTEALMRATAAGL
ncbi:PadR family transcriptional regulator [Conexibacter arvalis]|uniref:PadR family transcriptional regulator n=1 Tax=Conexibacter arvalis TaxID=912552 RepID=UPI001C85DA1E|nr:helix-turn-helix transcriptional regulator [Conexibacter arvalis]